MMMQPKPDPRQTDTGWDQGWENAVEEGEGLEEYLLEAGDETFKSRRGYHKSRLDYPHMGKNEPEDPYLQ